MPGDSYLAYHGLSDAELVASVRIVRGLTSSAYRTLLKTSSLRRDIGDAELAEQINRISHTIASRFRALDIVASLSLTDASKPVVNSLANVILGQAFTLHDFLVAAGVDARALPFRAVCDPIMALFAGPVASLPQVELERQVARAPAELRRLAPSAVVLFLCVEAACRFASSIGRDAPRQWAVFGPQTPV